MLQRLPDERAEKRGAGVAAVWWPRSGTHPILFRKCSLSRRRHFGSSGRTSMSVTIDLPPDTEAELAAQAAARGVPLAEHLCHLLAEQAGASKARRKTPEERIRL